MKKRIVAFAMLIFVALLSGCGANNRTAQTKLLDPDLLAQGVYDALEEEWAAFDALTEQEKMLSSRTPGLCQQSFEDWNACEEFLGGCVPNPMEGAAWLERGTYVGMPVGYADAPNIMADWYGTREGAVEWLALSAGYRHDQCRVMLTATLYTTPPEELDSGWGVELVRSDYLKLAENGESVVTKDSGAAYTAATATLARGEVLYTLRVVGEPDMETNVEQTLEKLLDLFEE